jgi:hypothetical protein
MTELIRALAGGRRPRPSALVAPLIVLALLGAAALAVGAGAWTAPDDEPRTITVEARGMAFYVAGAGAANPAIPARRGERLRFVLVHRDPGMIHDFALPSLDAGTAVLREAGASAELVVRVPERAGDHQYVCTSHARMMRGVLEVR